MATIEDIDFEALVRHVENWKLTKSAGLNTELADMIAGLCGTKQQDTFEIIKILMNMEVINEPVITAMQRRDDRIEASVLITGSKILEL